MKLKEKDAQANNMYCAHSLANAISVKLSGYRSGTKQELAPWLDFTKSLGRSTNSVLFMCCSRGGKTLKKIFLKEKKKK